jgi:CheY-like chemotaxis protein
MQIIPGERVFLFGGSTTYPKQMTSIFYIDDDVEDIEIFGEAVKTVDPTIRYFSAGNATEALDVLNSSGELPDHIVIDFNMPGLDGKHCLKEIRKNPRFNPINIVIYSTNSFPRDIEQIRSLDANFIRKANSFDELCDIIKRLIEP